MKNTKLKVLGCGALLATLLTSCGTTPLDAERPVDMNADTSGVTIDWWTGFGEDIKDNLENELIPAFKEATGIEIVHTSKGGYDNLQKAVNLGAGQRTYPNICVGYPDHFASYIASNMQLRLDPYFRDDPDGAAYEADLYPSYMEENRQLEFKEDGTGYILGVPFNKSTEVLVYNEDFFNSPIAQGWGITKVPETWDEIETYGEIAVRNLTPHFGKIIGTDGNDYTKESDLPEGVKVWLNLTSATADTFFFLGYDSTSNLFISALRQWGGKYTEIDTSNGLGYAVYNNPQTVEMLTFMDRLASKHILAIPASFGGTSLYCSDYYKVYQCLMNVGSSAGLGHYTAPTLKSSSGVTAVPYKDADHKYVISQGTNLAMLNKGSDVEVLASWKALKYLTTGEANGLFCALTGYYPATKSAYNSETYQSFLNARPSDENDANKKKAAKANSEIYDAEGSGWHKFVDVGFNGSSVIRTEVGNLISSVLLTDTDIQTLINQSYDAISNYVRK